jgi:4'-phosphopantetheinyl transferase
MPLLKTIPVPDGLIGVWQMTENAAGLIAAFSNEELCDPIFTKYANEKRQIEWLSTRLLIRQMIGANFTISYLPTGKPILEHSTFKKISISHSRSFAAVIVHQKKNVGIDIEETNRNFNRISQRYLSADEQKQTDKDASRLCLYWCAKEAIFKLVDDEGIDFSKQILVKSDQNARYISEGRQTNFKLEHEFFEGNCLVWVIGGK